MAIKLVDIKLLWGRAAGLCSNPSCRADLTKILESGTGYVIGEMAHLIAHAEGGPRGRAGGGSDEYVNLILLCPTCHTHIDKAPEGEFAEELLLNWKKTHENEIGSRGARVTFESFEVLKEAVCKKLMENRRIFELYGPHSKIAQTDPESNAVEIWKARKISKILPNNREIVNLIEANIALLAGEFRSAYTDFREHAEAYELSQISRLDHYPLFPPDFGRLFCDE